MGDNHTSIFFPHEIEEEIGKQDPRIDDEDGRDRFYHIIEDQESAENKGGILRKRKSNASKHKKDKETQIRPHRQSQKKDLSL